MVLVKLATGVKLGVPTSAVYVTFLSCGKSKYTGVKNSSEEVYVTLTVVVLKLLASYSTKSSYSQYKPN